MGVRRQRRSPPMPPFPFYVSLFWVGIGVRRHSRSPPYAPSFSCLNTVWGRHGSSRQNRSPPMLPLLCLAGLTQKIAGKAAAPLRRPSFISLNAGAFAFKRNKHSRCNQDAIKKYSRCIHEAIKCGQSRLSGIDQDWEQVRIFSLDLNSIKSIQAATPGPLTECRSDTHLDTLSRRSS